MKIIGIGGPSCSGKSTLAKNVEQELNALRFSVDSFYKKDAPKIYIANSKGELVRTFERPELYDGAYVAECISELKKGNKIEYCLFDWKEKIEKVYSAKPTDVLIVEGFLMYTYPELKEIIDYAFYVDIPYDEMLYRREQRKRSKGDQTFLEIGVQEYKLFGEGQKNIPNLIILNGLESPAKLRTRVLEYVSPKIYK